MSKEHMALAGLVFGGAGLFLGITLSSAIPESPFVYGMAAAAFSAVVAAVVGGIRRNADEQS